MDNFEDFEDETIWERIKALEEMVPSPIKKTLSVSCSWAKSIYSGTRAVSWALVSTGAILVLPISLENERQEYLDSMKREERNIILGPQSGI